MAPASGDGHQETDGPAEPRRPRPVRYWFSSAAAGKSSLLRLVMANLPGWREETAPHIQRAADERWCDEKQPRCVLWLDKVDRSGRVFFASTDIALGIQSRLDGMKDVANKSDMERAFSLCRDLGLAGYRHGPQSFFPRTWLLPEQRAEFEAHVRERRLDALARKAPTQTFILKPAGGSEGLGITLLRHERQVPRYAVATAPMVAQDYIAPMLLGGKKFDLRLYVLIRSVDPLEVYLHREGLARFCTEPYQVRRARAPRARGAPARRHARSRAPAAPARAQPRARRAARRVRRRRPAPPPAGSDRRQHESTVCPPDQLFAQQAERGVCARVRCRGGRGQCRRERGGEGRPGRTRRRRGQGRVR
jgi:hypothetical protein